MTKVVSKILASTFLFINCTGWAEVAQVDDSLAKASTADERIDWNSDLCATQKQFLEAQIKARLTVDDLAQSIAKKSPQIVLVGETHAEQTPEFHEHLFRKLKKAMPALNCVALETNESMVKQSAQLRPTWRRLELAAKKVGSRVYLIDKYFDEHIERDAPNSSAAMAGGLNERSRSMAGHLQKLLKDRKCTKIMVINGSGHLMTNPNDQRPGMPQRLNEAGISTFNLLTVDLTETDSKKRRNSRDTWIWPKGPPPGEDWGHGEAFAPKCPDVPGRVGENYAFVNTDQPLAKKVPIAYINDKDRGTIGAMSQFDGVLMLECPTIAGTRCFEPNAARTKKSK